MGFRILQGDCLETLATLPAGSVQTCVTSPPYYNLRDYGIDGQIGLEETPDAYVARLVEVFREVRRVLRDDGTLWLNIGDSYNADGRKGRAHMGKGKNAGYSAWVNKTMAGTKPKDLLGIPWMVAFALRADGWYLRSEIVWQKPNPMPESVRDRPTSAHEKVFLLTKSPTYFYDIDAVREPHAADSLARVGRGRSDDHKWVDGGPGNQTLAADITRACHPNGRNARNVWTITPKGYRGAHFATMPVDLAERCIKAGTSERGQCPHCAAPWGRVTQEVSDNRKPYATQGAGTKAGGAGRNDGGGLHKVLREDGTGGDLATKRHITTGWAPSCGCPKHEPVAQVVLDPFGGAGTTALAAQNLGRDAILCELNPEYVALATERLSAPVRVVVKPRPRVKVVPAAEVEPLLPLLAAMAAE